MTRTGNAARSLCAAKVSDWEEYGIEGMSPNYLARNGWDKHTLSAGDKVEVTIHPLKDGRKGGFDVRVKLPDGKMIYNLPHAN